MQDTGYKIDTTAFEAIYRRHWKKLFNICYNRLADEHIAEEIVQDIFQSLWERRKNFVVEGPIEHYLVRAAKLEIMDFYRTGTRRQHIRNHLFMGYSELDESTEQTIYGRDLQEHISQLVDRLPEACRTVYQFSRLHGLNNKEIAQKLSISIKTVEYHLGRALQFLRINLQQHKS